MVAAILLAIVAGVGAVTLMAGPGPVGVRWAISLFVIVVAVAAAMAVILHGRNYRKRVEEKRRSLDGDLKDREGRPS